MRWSSVAAIGAIGGALGLFVNGCDIIVVNDFPGGKGWGSGLTGTGGEGGQATGGGGGAGATAQCTECHGNESNAAPPLDMNGNSDPTLPTVGSHQAHLVDSAWHHPVPCEECHTMPATTICPDPQSNHCDGLVDVVFGTLANSDGASSTYDTGTYVCGNNYCHGSTLEVDLAPATSLRSPIFNVVDGTYSGCGTACHTNPPGDPHPLPGAAGCGDAACHGMVITSYDDAGGGPPTVVWADATRHIDGISDAAP